MPRRRTIFVSSVASEFSDLRSALQYELDRRGLTVLLSEDPEFPISGRANSLDECRNVVRGADYYLLLLGEQRGSAVLDDSSPTREEYLAALTAWRDTGRPQLVLTVRARTAGAIAAADPWVARFLQELQRRAGPDVPTYVSRWNSFKDLIEIVSTRVNLGESHEETLWRHRVRQEAVRNLRRLVSRSDDTVFPDHWHLRLAANSIAFDEENWMEEQYVAPDVMRSLGAYGVSGAGSHFQLSAMQQAVSEGVFLDWDPAREEFVPSELHLAVEQTIFDCEAAHATSAHNDAQRKRLLAAALGDLPDQSRVDGPDALHAIGYFDKLENAFQSLSALARFLLGSRTSPTVDPADRRPESPVPKWAGSFWQFGVEESDLVELLRKQISPFGPNFTKTIVARAFDPAVRERRVQRSEAIIRAQLANTSLMLTDGDIRTMAESIEEESRVAMDGDALDGIIRRDSLQDQAGGS